MSPAGFAELYVAAFVAAGEGTEDTLAAYFPGEVTLEDVVPGAYYAARTAAINTTNVARDYWSVVVGAEVLRRRGERYLAAGMRYFTVGIARSDQGWVATSLPGEVAAPTAGRDSPEVSGALMSTPDYDDPAVQALAGFFSAYLTGSPELGRYLAPGVRLASIARYSAVEISRVAFEPMPPAGHLLARAEVTATDDAGWARLYHYAAELTRRAGRWEVRRLLPSAPLANEETR